jgi:hypothetical protein
MATKELGNFKLATVGHLRSVSLASGASTQTTGLWEKAGKCSAYVAVCMTATLSAGTATYQFFGASDADGTGAAAIGSTLVHSAAGSVGLLRLNILTVTSAKPYISVVCTTAAGTGICGATVMMVDPNYSA